MFNFKHSAYEFEVGYEPIEPENNVGDGFYFIDGWVIDPESLDDPPLSPRDYWRKHEREIIGEIERFYGEP